MVGKCGNRAAVSIGETMAGRHMDAQPMAGRHSVWMVQPHASEVMEGRHPSRSSQHHLGHAAANGFAPARSCANVQLTRDEVAGMSTHNAVYDILDI